MEARSFEEIPYETANAEFHFLNFLALCLLVTGAFGGVSAGGGSTVGEFQWQVDRREWQNVDRSGWGDLSSLQGPAGWSAAVDRDSERDGGQKRTLHGNAGCNQQRGAASGGICQRRSALAGRASRRSSRTAPGLACRGALRLESSKCGDYRRTASFGVRVGLANDEWR